MVERQAGGVGPVAGRAHHHLQPRQCASSPCTHTPCSLPRRALTGTRASRPSTSCGTPPAPCRARGRACQPWVIPCVKALLAGHAAGGRRPSTATGRQPVKPQSTLPATVTNAPALYPTPCIAAPKLRAALPLHATRASRKVHRDVGCQGLRRSACPCSLFPTGPTALRGVMPPTHLTRPRMSCTRRSKAGRKNCRRRSRSAASSALVTAALLLATRCRDSLGWAWWVKGRGRRVWIQA